MTGINDITRLIQANPSGLRLGESESAFGNTQAVVDDVTSALRLYREAQKGQIDKRERKKLEERLLITAARLQELIDHEELDGSRRDKELACEHQKLIAETASELGLDLQQFQQRTLQWV